jgi:protein-S-isoprenylcysteine O-methyltransferase Ste14
MAQREPLRRTLEELQKSTLEWVDLEAERLQEQAWNRARNAGRKVVAAIFGVGLLLLGLQAAVLSILFVLHERATQFVVRPGVAWPMAGFATALITLGAFALIYGFTVRRSSGNPNRKSRPPQKQEARLISVSGPPTRNTP